jgi:5-(carboxyamino)imidazole ribonucleotide mutase
LFGGGALPRTGHFVRGSSRKRLPQITLVEGSGDRRNRGNYAAGVPFRRMAASSPTASTGARALVGIIMGSTSDWETMSHAAETLGKLGVPHETQVVSAHRTPDLLFEYAASAESRGLEVIIAGAGGAAHLPGMAASKTVLPVLGVPVESKALHGMDSLLSIVQMPGGIPVGTLAIGKAGAINAALLAAAICGIKHPEIREALRRFREEQTQAVLSRPDPRAEPKHDSRPGRSP